MMMTAVALVPPIRHASCLRTALRLCRPNVGWQCVTWQPYSNLGMAFDPALLTVALSARDFYRMPWSKLERERIPQDIARPQAALMELINMSAGAYTLCIDRFG